MRTRTPCLIASATALLLLGSFPALADTSGAVYPVPGGPGVGHGGSSCFALSSAEAAMGKTAAQNGTSTAGQTWYFGAGIEPAQTGTGCGFSATATTDAVDFDRTRFERLFWGASEPPQLALDGTVDSPGETLTLDPLLTDLANGVVGWSGSTSMAWCQPASCPSFTTSAVPTRVVLQVSDAADHPAALLDPASVDISGADVGGVVEVTSQVPRFHANIQVLAQDPTAPAGTYVPAISMYNGYNHPLGGDPQTRMSFGGAFRFVSRAPVGSIGGPNPLDHQQATFTADATDPDGTVGDVLTYAWDLDHDGQYDDGTAASASATYGVGSHTVRVQVTDPDGAVGTLTRAFTVADTTAPTATLALASARIRTLLAKGLPGTVTVNEPATAALKATLGAAIAKRLKLRNPVATGSATVAGSGSKAFHLTFTTAAKRRLKTLGKVTVTVSAVVRDTAGNARSVSKSRTYRR